MELQIKHLAGYLPYGLSFLDAFGNKFYLFDKINDFDYEYSKPILHPLSDLTKEIEVNGEKFVPIDWLDDLESEVCSYSIDYYINHTKRLPYYRIERLLEWHFDIYGLIDAGLAIDINTL